MSKLWLKLAILIICSLSFSITPAICEEPSAGTYMCELEGNWQGFCRVSTKQLNDSTVCSKDSLTVNLIIHTDGRVTGKAGNARFMDCHLYKNRGWLGRLLNFKTDYIIKGRLNGPLVECDTVRNKRITLPFNVSDQRLKGTLFRIHKWKYPYPMVRIILHSDDNPNKEVFERN